MGALSGSARIVALGAAAWVALFFACGRFSHAAAAWVGPLLFLRFLHALPRRRVLPIGYAMLASVTLAQWWGAWGPLRGPVVYSGVAVGALLLFAPYLVHQRLTGGRSSFVWTLIFPCAFVTAEFLFSLLIATEGALGYTQVKVLPLLQLTSVTGVFGVTFVVAWFASVVSWVIDRWPEWKEAWKGAAIYGGVLLTIVGLGEARLHALDFRDGTTIRVASFTLENDEAWRGARMTPPAREAIRKLNDRLLERAAREAAAGAELVLWSEVNAVVMSEDEPALLKRAGEVARTSGIELGMALAIVTPGAPLIENRLIVIDRNGAVASRYEKSFLAPGEPSIAGDFVLRSARTGGSLVTGAICADLSQHRLIRQAGAMGADVMLAPAAEWPEIDPAQTWVAVFRAVESGVSMVKETRAGPSAIVDPAGRILAWRPRSAGDSETLRASIPVRGTRTIYSRIGDSFAFACVAALALLAVVARSASRGLR